MKDILNLFRRDAEVHADGEGRSYGKGGYGDYGGGGVGLGEKTRVLSPVEDGKEKEGGRVRAGVLRVSPPVMEKGRAQQPRDEGVWGRRW